ncbi:MAG: flavodoxin-dependent (E)-4-hydroxy-3-methylbut-2-enyl-diphosphate synthase [Deltaproteobacteria bacterium]|nr:flavodoxin-dependent (E)-4-hydroxy-3-methylbut-2-enyl-diphosphate synthase [Deltaproteobacteria bacterium]
MRTSREILIGKLRLGGQNRIAVQSMCATRTQDREATLRQIRLLEKAGADLIRVAIDSEKDAEVLRELSQETDVPLSVDLQENYRLAEKIAPCVQKIRYNPGHLHHHEKQKTSRDKVAWLAEQASKNRCAIRIGVNCGSVDPVWKERYPDNETEALVSSAVEHCQFLDDLGFKNYLVSLKDSDPMKVVETNRRFHEMRPDVPLHLGVTEAGLPPEGVIKTRIAFERLISQGIGDTVRVSLTVPFDQKGDEIHVAREILRDIAEGRFRSVPDFGEKKLNIISCPSCSRVENEKFVELAIAVKEMSRYAKEHAVTIAVMGCRVNGPGETDDADLGLWCAPNFVNLKKKEEQIGTFSYEEILPRLKQELDQLIQK